MDAGVAGAGGAGGEGAGAGAEGAGVAAAVTADCRGAPGNGSAMAGELPDADSSFFRSRASVGAILRCGASARFDSRSDRRSLLESAISSSLRGRVAGISGAGRNAGAGMSVTIVFSAPGAPS